MSALFRDDNNLPTKEDTIPSLSYIEKNVAQSCQSPALQSDGTHSCQSGVQQSDGIQSCQSDVGLLQSEGTQSCQSGVLQSDGTHNWQSGVLQTDGTQSCQSGVPKSCQSDEPQSCQSDVSPQSENDLPLMSNTERFLIRHYYFNWKCDFKKRILTGSVYLFVTKAPCSHCDMRVFSVHAYQRLNPVKCDACRQAEGTVNEAENSSDTSNEDSHKSQDASAPHLERVRNDNDLDVDFNNLDLVLDCHDLDIHSVYSLPVNVEDLTLATEHWSASAEQFKDRLDDLLLAHCDQETLLEHSTDKLALNITLPDVALASVVRVNYSTRSVGASIRWAKDQDKRLCMFSAGMWVNNRALFPCQEFGALSTWHATITTPRDTVLLITSDNIPVAEPEMEDTLTWRCWSSAPLPTFTLAMAVGYWEVVEFHQNQIELTRPPPCNPCTHSPRCLILYATQPTLPCRLIAPSSRISSMRSVLQEYTLRSITAVQQILGAYPYPKVDIMLYPPCSQDMALASGSLLFISQSLLCADGTMTIRIGHELSHAWFGLLLGAKDWTEEWLSEGFATYMEDSIHAGAMEWDCKRRYEHSELRALIKHRVLTAELENTDENLQTLRPNSESPASDGFVKNGINPSKQFTQVHYLKGYFLLNFLSRLVDVDRFNGVIRKYVDLFHGQMVLSKDFLNLVLDELPELRQSGLTLDVLYRDWLDCTGMPRNIRDFQVDPNNSLYIAVQQQFDLWKRFIEENPNCRKSKAKRLRQCHQEGYNFSKLCGDQLVLLLELLLQFDHLNAKVLQQMLKVYCFPNQNADVRHRWCELIVKHLYKPSYQHIREFLINEQSMGVYLYGELTLSGCKHMKTLAFQCFSECKEDMEAGTKNTIHAMLYGTSP